MTQYPAQIDGYASLPLVIDGVTEIRAQDHNSLRNTIIAIEQELGIQPSGVFATVRARLDSVSDAEALISSHIANTIDAHDASAILILDTPDNYVSTEVEGALGELASVLPASFDTIGNDNTAIPNSGIPSFVGGSGTLHVFTTTGADIVKKTQPVNVTGVVIIDVGDNNGTGTGTLTFTAATDTIAWTAPGDLIGTAVDISSLGIGQVATLESATTTKRIRITRNAALPTVGVLTDTFDLLQFDAGSGTFSITGTGFKDSTNITRTATSSTGASRLQFMIGGMVFPADKGTLVLQRKLRLGADQFSPIAVLDLGTNFTEALREDGQLVYTPALASFDTITLFDRLPARNDYETLTGDADGNDVYDNFTIDAIFTSFQVAKYLIPVSNSLVTGGELEAPTDTTSTEIESKVSAYRIVHYRAGVTDFNGEPAAADIFSLSDPLAGADDGDNNVRMSNVYVDTNTDRPSIRQVILRPVLDVEATEKIISGIHYYNNSSDLFDIELVTPNLDMLAPAATPDMFTNAYLHYDVLRFTTDALDFPTGDGYGLNVDVEKMLDDGYEFFSVENLPTFSDYAFYLLNSSYLDAYRPSIGASEYSNNVSINATIYDPFGAGTAFPASGSVSVPTVSTSYDARILANSFVTGRATNTREYFTDESKRVGTTETFNFALDVGQFSFEDGPGTNGTLVDFVGPAPLVSGELQCGGLFSLPSSPGLVYPQSDYDPTTAEIRPTQQASTDYSGFTGDAIYQRLFSLGRATNGGRLRIVSSSSGGSLVSFATIDFNNASRPIQIAIKIPGVGTNSTGWLDIGRLFETVELDDNSGALSGTVTGASGDFTVPFTTGTRNNADTGFMFAVRITYFNAVLADAKSRVISMLELLP